MKLNRKGYMLVEIVVASVLAMGIAYYLLNLTYRFKNLDEDIYQSYLYVQDRNLIVKNVMNDLEKKSIVEIGTKKVEGGNQYVDFKCSDDTYMRVKLVKDGSKTNFYYGKLIVDSVTDVNKIAASVVYDTKDISYYEREFEQILMVGDIEVEFSDSIVTFNIPVNSVYDDKDYSIKFFGSRSSKHIPLKLELIDYNDSASVKLGLKINDADAVSVIDCTSLICGSFEPGSKLELVNIYLDEKDDDSNLLPFEFKLEIDKKLRIGFMNHNISGIMYK